MHIVIDIAPEEVNATLVTGVDVLVLCTITLQRPVQRPALIYMSNGDMESIVQVQLQDYNADVFCFGST